MPSVMWQSVPDRVSRAGKLAGLALRLGLLGAAAGPVAAQEGGVTQAVVTVFAAASTSDGLTRIARLFETTHPAKIRVSLAASSLLARQIEQGAPCEIFLSADQEWMDYLEQRGRIRKATRHNLLGNVLVVVTLANQPLTIRMERAFDFPGAFSGRLAVGDPAHVPAGKYAKEALQFQGWWQGLEGRLAPAENVRAALMMVERGETAAGIVYATDARASKAVLVAAEFPEAAHRPILYPVALCPEAGAAAAQFLDYISGQEAGAIWKEAGFRTMPPADPGRHLP